jgi:Tfp pilus assembly protein PilV
VRPAAAGLSVLEVLLAAVVLTVALVALAGVIPLAAYGVHEGSRLSTAAFLVEQGLERARIATWTADEDCLGVSSSAGAAPVGRCAGASRATFADEVEPGALPGFIRTTRIADCAAPGTCGGVPGPVAPGALRRVTVEVSYRPLTGTGVSATATSARADQLVTRR